MKSGQYPFLSCIAPMDSNPRLSEFKYNRCWYHLTEFRAVRARSLLEFAGNVSSATVPVLQMPTCLVRVLHIPKPLAPVVCNMYFYIFSFSDDLSAFLCSDILVFVPTSFRQSRSESSDHFQDLRIRKVQVSSPFLWVFSGYPKIPSQSSLSFHQIPYSTANNTMIVFCCARTLPQSRKIYFES